MPYCRKCGKELSEGARYCPACGSQVGTSNDYRPEQVYAPYKQEETGAIAWGILSFVLTIFTAVGGIILALVLFGCGKPKGGVAALLGMVLAIVVGILVIAYFITQGASNSSTLILSQMIS